MNPCFNILLIFPAILKKCPEVACPPGFEVKPIKTRKSKMMSRFSDSEEDDSEDEPPTKPQFYYIKANYQASYEAVLPISTSARGRDINQEECYRFMCIPIVDTSPDYYTENERPPLSCPDAKCPNGYLIKFQPKKSATSCQQYLN